MVPRLTNIKYCIIIRCLSRRGKHGCHAALQFADFLCHRVIGRVLEPGIKVPAVFQVEQSAHLVAGIILKCRALVNRQDPWLPFLWAPARLDAFCLYLVIAHVPFLLYLQLIQIYIAARRLCAAISCVHIRTQGIFCPKDKFRNKLLEHICLFGKFLAGCRALLCGS